MQVTETVRNVAAHLDDGDEIPMAIFSVAIPYFLVRLTTICVERRELSVPKEFILRSVQTGWNTTAEISGFLGVQAEDIQLEIDSLIDEFFISMHPSSKVISVMEKGLRAISENGLTVPTIREAACYVNGITRELDLSPEEMLPRRKLSLDMFVLPSVPARAPKADELDISSVKRAVLSSKLALPWVIEVARIGRVVRTNNLYVTGQLLLRRGAHTMPIICVKGSVDTGLAFHVGAHPALQSVKAAVGRHEQNVKRLLSQRKPIMRQASFLPPTNVLNAISSLVSYCDTLATNRKTALQQFIDASDGLVEKTHWVSNPEAQVLFLRAISCAKAKILIVLPPESRTIVDLSALEELQGAIARGVVVEIHGVPNDPRLSDKKFLRRNLKGANVVTLLSNGGWFGFCCDQSFVVIGAVKSISSSMGRCDTFFGAVIIDDIACEKLLYDLAVPVDVQIKIKKKKITLMPNSNNS